ncbi:hypothetical protein V6N12_073949 [Hibiscus sabdariffa]|uniref:Protein kinase domain-containing protein n=1 Tax=Hibiscus sabdariffa TaxID=183260 RepID=A0ABR2AN49_9ROSI
MSPSVLVLALFQLWQLVRSYQPRHPHWRGKHLSSLLFEIVGSILPQYADLSSLEHLDLPTSYLTGGYGSVYRAQIPSGKIVALKKLHRREAEVVVSDMSFKDVENVI